MEVRAWGLGGLTSFDVWVTYFDLAGKEWVTSAKYLVSEEGSRYTNLWVASKARRATGWVSSSSGRHTRKRKVRECQPTG